VLLIAFFAAVKAELNPKAKRPGPLQNFAEFMVQGFYGIVQGVTGDHKKTRFFMPYFMSFFLFIIANNWFGLLPGVGTIGFTQNAEGTQHAVLQQKEMTAPVGVAHAQEEVVVDEHAADHTETTAPAAGEEHAVTEEHATTEEHADESHAEGVYVPYLRAGTADLNTTLALSLFTMGMVQFIGVKYLGLAYFKKFFNFKDPISFFVSILEIVSEVAKIVSFSFRLFGNIFAGEVLLIVIGALVPIIVPMPFYGLEIFVGFIQALVFSLLSVVFFNVATVSHDEH
jgi:F-type H+-transporting ATPase subunit a